ncbi:hypothetical protein, partial [Niastella populi]|uniref:hypothetical protein n=1 Tax=Niastella populi TaxID=550983 RepID=UPI001A98B7C2
PIRPNSDLFMPFFYSFIESYLNGNSISKPIRRFTDLLLSASIVSFIFNRFIFKYEWISITDYKAVLDFFIQGHFVVPIILFTIVHIGLANISSIIFTITTLHKSSKFIKQIKKYQVKKRDYKAFFKKMNNNEIFQLPIEFNETVLLKAYYHLKNNISEEEWKKAETEGSKLKENLENDFNLTVKAIVATAIYFYNLSYFRFGLFITSLAILLLIAIALWYFYVLVYILPSVLNKIDTEFQNYIATQQDQGNITQIDENLTIE